MSPNSNRTQEVATFARRQPRVNLAYRWVALSKFGFCHGLAGSTPSSTGIKSISLVIQGESLLTLMAMAVLVDALEVLHLLFLIGSATFAITNAHQFSPLFSLWSENL